MTPQPPADVPRYPRPDMTIPAQDLFASVIDTETAEIAQQERKCNTIRLAITMADGLLGMAGSAHYQQYVAALADLQRSRTNELLTATNDREANVLAGRCLELRDILTMVTKTQNTRASLAVALEQAEDRLDQLINPEKRTFLS